MTRGAQHRPQRLAALILETVAQALGTLVKDPRVGFVTITRVAVSRDASLASVSVSVLGTDEEKARAMDGLDSARGFLRTHLAQTLKLRTTPELRFMLDRGLEHAQRVDRLLADIKRSETSP
jgi:ribosome-binding factor A